MEVGEPHDPRGVNGRVKRRTAERRQLTILLAVAVAVSIVHYVDNTVAYAAYPQSETLPNPSRTLVGAAWFVFTAFGIVAYVLYTRGRRAAAAVCLAVYSGSGLVGIGHYAAGGVKDSFRRAGSRTRCCVPSGDQSGKMSSPESNVIRSHARRPVSYDQMSMLPFVMPEHGDTAAIA